MAVATAFDAEVGGRVRKARERAGLSVEELAEKLGVASSTLYAWEAGRRGVSLEAILAISRLLVTPLEELATGELGRSSDVERLADLLLRATEEAMAGATPAEAFDRVSPSPTELSPRERRFLERRSDEFRRFIEARASRPWLSLTEAERLELARAS